MSNAVYLVNGARTPLGSFMGALSGISAPELGAIAITATLQKANLSHDKVEEVYMGCVLPAGIGQAPARQALRKAGIPDSVGAVTLNKVCGSGMQAVVFAQQHILSGEADLIIAGGMENMSQAPHLLKNSRTGYRLGDQNLIDSLVYDGLWDPYDNKHMGSCAEQCAQKYGFTQADQDAFAIQSYERALKSIEQKLFVDEIAPVTVTSKKETIVVDTDEEPGKGNIQKLPGLKPAFEKEGTITAGNASSLNDGAAALLVASEKAVKAHNLKPMAKIMATARHSQEPLWFTTAPIGAIQKVLEKANMKASDIDSFEINEAFSNVTMAAIKDLGLDSVKVNPRGGAVALGHPIGATGARLLVTLMHTLKQNNLKYGIASLCIGGGEALAVLIENVSA